MKNYLTLVSLLWMLPLSAQQTKPTNVMTPQQTEPSAPAILDKEATTFFEAFQTAVAYIANKKVDPKKRRAYAESFASQFAEGAKIEVQNGEIKKLYAPLAYFNRLIDLEYEQVKIKIKLKDKTQFQQDTKSWWATTYTFDQLFLGTRNGKTLVKDYTIKTIGLYFLYVPASGKWTKKYGHVLVHSTQSLN
jgi:hypothetical protein